MSLKIIIMTLVLCLCVYCDASEKSCIVCNRPVIKNETHIVYRGASHPVCSGRCLKEWKDAVQKEKLDSIVFKVEPRGALFQGDSKFLNSTFQKTHPLSSNWLWMGIWILTAIISGGWAAALATVLHRSGVFAFILGFLLPGLGILAVKLLPVTPGIFNLRGTKIPTTHSECFCPQCTNPCHPSSEHCSRCGSLLTPKFKSEVTRIET